MEKLVEEYRDRGKKEDDDLESEQFLSSSEADNEDWEHAADAEEDADRQNHEDLQVVDLIEKIQITSVSSEEEEKEEDKVKEGEAEEEEEEDIVKMLENQNIRVHNGNKLRIIMNRLRKKKYQNVIVMSGAGISTSSGIPDFRSAKTGLYDNLEEYNLPYPEAIFDVDFYRENPRPFIRLAKSLLPDNYNPTPAHFFIREMEDQKILLRNFTQNIDNLESKAGISPEKLVQAHGSFASAHCIECRQTISIDIMRSSIMEERIVTCFECEGYVKPAITFFGESLPNRFHQCVDTDFDLCDLLFVMGTSLTVFPFAGLVRLTPSKTSRILINRDLVGDVGGGGGAFDFKVRDVALLGDLDDACRVIAKYLNWTLQQPLVTPVSTNTTKTGKDVEEIEKE